MKPLFTQQLLQNTITYSDHFIFCAAIIKTNGIPLNKALIMRINDPEYGDYFEVDNTIIYASPLAKRLIQDHFDMIKENFGEKELLRIKESIITIFEQQILSNDVFTEDSLQYCYKEVVSATVGKPMFVGEKITNFQNKNVKRQVEKYEKMIENMSPDQLERYIDTMTA